jgi:hypothetical protein
MNSAYMNCAANPGGKMRPIHHNAIEGSPLMLDYRCVGLAVRSQCHTRETPSLSDYCQRVQQETPGKKHGFLAGNVRYYVGGLQAMRFGSVRPPGKCLCGYTGSPASCSKVHEQFVGRVFN